MSWASIELGRGLIGATFDVSPAISRLDPPPEPLPLRQLLAFALDRSGMTRTEIALAVGCTSRQRQLISMMASSAMLVPI